LAEKWTGGTTDIKQALVKTNEVVATARPNAQLLIVIFTDGYSFTDVEPEASQLQAVKNANVYAIAFKEISFHMPTMIALAGSEDHVFTYDNFDKFLAVEKTFTSTCHVNR